MRAMMLNSVSLLDNNLAPLTLTELSDPVPGEGEILIRVTVCGVCHTELDEVEGRTSPPFLPIIPGHQVVGRVEDYGPDVTEFKRGDHIGVGWIFSACGTCAFCRRGDENICPDFQATGRDKNGGYAELMVVPVAFAIPLPEKLSDAQMAPLLCAGAVGYRALQLTGLQNGQNLGFTGFGASAHLILQVVKHVFTRTKIFVFARDEKERAFASDLGAEWTGEIGDTAPEQLHAIIDTTPAWTPVMGALRNLAPGGRLVINAIRKEGNDQLILLQLDYAEHIWMEKEIKSVANVTRRDIKKFLELAAEIPLRAEIQEYNLEDANQALSDMKFGHIRGSKILRVAY